MNVVFQLASRPELRDAQRLSEALYRQRGVAEALVDSRAGRVFVTFDPDQTGDLALQSVIENQGFLVTTDAEPLGFTTDTPGNLSEIQEEEMSLGQAVQLTRDAEFTLPDDDRRL